MIKTRSGAIKAPACFFLLLVMLISACVPQQSASVRMPAPDYWPTAGWKSSTAEAQGMDSDLLAQMLERVTGAQTNIYSVLIIRNGYIVTEAYSHPFTRDTSVHIQSVTKSVIGALVGRAIHMGAIQGVDETLVSFFPGRVFANASEQKDSIRLSHLLSMSSGLDCREFSDSGPKMEQSNSWVSFMLDLPVVDKPGTKFGYCNGNAHLLSAIIEKSTGMNTREFANQELFAPLGIPAVDRLDWWSDPNGFSTGGYGLHLRPVDMAKLALLSLQNGKWEDQQLFPGDWMIRSTTQQVIKEDGSGYGYLWTVYPRQGHYVALGLGGQQIHIYPSRNLIVVVTAGLKAYAEAPEIEEMLNNYILPSIKSRQPLADNPQGVLRLQAAVEAAANPIQPVAKLPPTALDISNSTYVFGENPFGWQSMRMVFTPAADTAQLYINDSTTIAVGLNNLFRLTDSPLLGKLMLRGRWEDDNTFVVDYPYTLYGAPRLGELAETEMRFTFNGDQLEIMITPLIFGGEPSQIHGMR
jgi:CubicO group peptidase (beta-lactamase class C family)